MQDSQDTENERVRKCMKVKGEKTGDGLIKTRWSQLRSRG